MTLNNIGVVNRFPGNANIRIVTGSSLSNNVFFSISGIIKSNVDPAAKFKHKFCTINIKLET